MSILVNRHTARELTLSTHLCGQVLVRGYRNIRRFYRNFGGFSHIIKLLSCSFFPIAPLTLLLSPVWFKFSLAKS